MVETHSFGVNPITCHAWNHDRSRLAFSPNNNEVHVYRRVELEWRLEDVLNQHDLRVTGIDWATRTNRLVTCAVDRNAYVWTQGDDGRWRPTLVLLRINRAATCVRWSPLENKFAVGSGARLISICYFESENDWWVSKHIKKPIRSTVTALDWHPNNAIIVAGSADFKVRLFSALIKDIEKAPEANAWGGRSSLGALIAEFPAPGNSLGGWVHAVSFSADGNRVAWVSHDSSIFVADPKRPPTRLKTQFLPYRAITWVAPDKMVAAGHDCSPYLYKVTPDGQLVMVCKLDVYKKREAGGLSAMRKFQSLDRNARIEPADTSLDSVHQNAITSICIHKGTKEACVTFSTTGLDGQLVMWDVNNLESAIQNLRL
ncbi:actin-related protein 2/3 complex subunit 1A [Cloeon dipterum]|uniref:Actin-related protein 2/3 complex subunit n=1 Tax=Cloeon dipterum TaxID=197152 RepID=A0A8S1BUG9_9INSE|nr:Hypothetical predicted protein [Cloeon dipterum]